MILQSHNGIGDAVSIAFPQAVSGAGAGVAAAGAGATMAASLATAGITAGIGLAVAGLTAWLAKRKQTAMQKEEATRIVDQLEVQLRQLRDAYVNNPDRTTQDQAQSLATFDAAMAWLSSQSACGNPALGSAGTRCLQERQQGGQWDWYAYYRKPIAETAPTKTVANNPASLSEITSVLTGGNASSDSVLPLLLIGALVIGAVALS